MNTAQQPEILDEDSWPVVSAERQPNGMLGVKLTFPLVGPVAEALGGDEISFNIEPKRARRLQQHLSALMEDMGL